MSAAPRFRSPAGALPTPALACSRLPSRDPRALPHCLWARREHQLIVAATHNASLIESICSGQARLSNASAYLAALLNLSAATDFVLGDGSRGQGLHNAALSPGRDYTALLRLVRLGPQVPSGAPAPRACCRPGLGPSLPLGCL